MATSFLGTSELRTVSERQRLVDVLMDPAQHAQKVLAGGQVVNVLTGEVYAADVAIEGQHIVMVGDCSDLVGPDTEVVDVSGKYLSPGFIDSHMHFESAMLTVTEFTRLSLPTGTTCLVSDPHEIGNVLGPVGIKAMCDEAALMPQHVHSRVPALTPDSPGLETAGYAVTSADIPEMLEYPTVSGIGETQGVTAAAQVYRHNPGVFHDTIVSTVYARSRGQKVDGNAAELFGRDLAAHIVAGGTDISCHETTTKAEAVEKLRQGVYVLMREGSTQRNMPECVRAVTEEGLDSRRVILATDDMLAEDIAKTGHMNDIIRRTIRHGVEPVVAIDDIGVLAPGKLADVAVIDGPLEEMNVSMVFLGGELVARDRQLLLDLPPYTYPDTVKHSVRRAPVRVDDLRVHSDRTGPAMVRCIGLILDQNLSEAVEATMQVANGAVVPQPENDLLPIAVVGRHGQPDIGASFVRGFKMKYGAIAETVSHDTHNIMVMGASYEDMTVAVNRVIELQGGLVLAKAGAVIGELPLRLGGLMTDELTAGELTELMIHLNELAKDELECQAHAPFMHLAFLSLSTSPVWKLTDKGVVDAAEYCVLPTIKTDAPENA
jgi:adenine deaminase